MSARRPQLLRRLLRQLVQRGENFFRRARLAGAQLHRAVTPDQDQPELAVRRPLQPLANIVRIKFPAIIEQRESAAASDDEHFDVFLDEAHLCVPEPFVLDCWAVVLRIGEDDQHPFAVSKPLERLWKFRLTSRCADDFMNDGSQHGAIPRPHLAGCNCAIAAAAYFKTRKNAVTR
ncbi:hypothetical protein RHE_CH02911 [Rhizobium etli CFN 42]|uniref:Uncharacterized protein n=1 Tax=Rhizobium etli (strain ATCC 51251 / DSM 11541 / JCM 21823 / NBRC 15573 / CFN 42) TaxID=347834 RepID=Q2K657_RHIEC|nr:hypothetical protein RHE_CH02911 [Rhizobium etli CFN 42]